MTSTSLKLSERHSLRAAVHTSSVSCVVLWAVAVALGPGAFLASRASILWPLATCVLWPLAGRWLQPAMRGHRHGACAFACSALASAATWLGVWLGMEPQATSWHGPDHPAFGEHPVAFRTGWPWRGVEGNGHGAAMEAIPFDMGVDALLVNFGVFALVPAVVFWRASGARCVDWAVVGAWLAAFGAVFGGWQLVVLFD